MSIQSRFQGKVAGFMGKLLSVSLLVWGLGVTFSPALAAVTVDQQPLITQKPLAPNIVLMLDDSGSMDWDYMPDWSYLKDTSADGLRNAAVNGVYYNPNTDYPLPPKANSTDASRVYYSNSPGIGNAYKDGFRDTSQVDVTTYYGSFPYYTKFTFTTTSTYAPETYKQATCPSGYSLFYGNCYKDKNPNKGARIDPTYVDAYRCNYGDTLNSSNMCETTTYSYKYFFTYTTGAVGGPYTQHYVGKSGECASLSTAQQAVCDDSAATRQKVANWFSYYRTRMQMAKSGLMSALSKVDSTYRMGFGSINGNNDGGLPDNKVQYGSNNNKIAPVEAFGDGSDGTQKARFWSWLNDLRPSNGTPLRRSLDAVGQYYQSDQPWQTSSSDSTELACRQSYTILTTDGFWNGYSPSVGEQDTTAGPTVQGPIPTPFTYSPTLPYSDGVASTKTYEAYQKNLSRCQNKYASLTGSMDGFQDSYYSGSICKFTYLDTSGSIFSDTLADVAMKYWKNDLRTSLTNEVPTSTEDSAFWQHMVTFTLGLGFKPLYADQTTQIPMGDVQKWANGDAAYAINNFGWPQPSSDSINNIADLAHAGIDGHGGFFQASDPNSFASGLTDALKRAASRVGTGASLAANSTNLKTGTVAYQANYFTTKWKGDLKALAVDPSTSAIASLPTWSASSQLPVAASRKIYTYNPTTGGYVLFKDAASLSSAQRTALGSDTTRQDVLNYLRGDSSKEQSNDGPYRNRETPLGDIVDSQPVYVADPDANLYNGQTFAGTGSYASFASSQASRTPEIYVASNDGMMHMFDADTGAETYAYLPGSVITNGLASLASPAYGTITAPHQFFNDGELTVADVYDSVAAAWRTVLVGTTGRGLARAVYALDVTDPANVKFLWERSATDGKVNSDYIGQMIGKPVIAQTADGDWSVFIGNGYNSARGTAALLQFDIDDGTLSVHTTDSTGSNGLAAPGLWIGDKTSGFSSMAYAGDLYGRVWSFVLNDVSAAPASSSTSATAPVATTTSNKTSAGTHIFTARDSDGNPQPITAGMLVGKDPATASNVWVFFGTGKYLDQTTDLVTSDSSTRMTQSLYGLIVDSSTSGLAVTAASTRTSSLVERQIVAETAGVQAQPADPDTGTPAVEGESPARAITQPDDATSIAGKSGWYIDLLSPQMDEDTGAVTSYLAEGERVVTPNLFQGNQLVVTTRIPEGADACNPSGRGWIMSIDPFTGAAPEASFFDINGDGLIDSKDSIKVGNKTLPASGIGFASLPNNPIFVGSTMLVSFDNGTTSSVKTSGSGGATERVSWRELINH